MTESLFTDPDDWIASNELAYAVREQLPISRGHALVALRQADRGWWDTSGLEKVAIFELVDAVKRRLDAEHSPEGYSVGFDIGTTTARSDGRFHVHVVPRYLGELDDLGSGALSFALARHGDSVTPAPSSTLVTPSDGRLKLELLRCLVRSDLDRIDLVVSFVMRSGINLIARHLDDALERGARVRLLTTDYLEITDPSALGFFLDRIGARGLGSLEAKVFSDPSTSFHPKAYIFSSSASKGGVAFVGSSNLSHSGITSGVEWNIETRHLTDLLTEYERLWRDPRSISLNSAWLASYETLRRERLGDRANTAGDRAGASDAADPESVESDGESPEASPQPWSVQAEALAALEATRIDGHESGLVVMATGLGKTWLAAFDSTRPEFKRVLFVAHREEILTQSRDVYRQLRPSGSLTLFTGNERDPAGDVVFASVQSLHRNLRLFSPEEFDYIVVDEFHHAAATTYRKVMAHFRPKFILGLTATPDRADAADLLALCSDNLVYDCGLVEGVGRGLLSPFTYHAIPDVAEYEHIPWRNGRFDPEQLTSELATTRRAQQVLDEWRRLNGPDRRALGFCSTIVHAEFMAEHFRDHGVSAVAVHSGAASAPRAESLERLENHEIDVIFTVDLFNEGVDIPAIDLVLMLRPTESPIVFFQQLGRGLRRHHGKDRLDALDLVGNHRSFLLKARLLALLAGRNHVTDREAVDFLRVRSADLASGSSELPEGCSILIDPSVIDLLAQLAGRVRSQDRLLELARQWVEDHDQRRPTALELALVNDGAFTLKSVGGWFGFLKKYGLLTADESSAVDIAADFLSEIEHGNYTKSFKLVTLGHLARSGHLRSGMSITELAVACQWEIMRDVDLRADLSDTSSSFEEVSAPTSSEWQRYWRKNPINAMTTASRGKEPWFTSDDDRLKLTFEVPEALGEVFDDLVVEIVEYRLHRYVTQQQTRRVGVKRTFRRDRAPVDATFIVESGGDGRPSSVVIEAAGGTRGTKDARNPDYVDGFDLLLQRLRDAGVRVLDIYIDTRSTKELALADRRLDPGSDHGYPLHLDSVEDLIQLRRSLLRSMAKAGRSEESTGGGNSRKRTRFVIDGGEGWTSVALAEALSSGDPSLGESATSVDHLVAPATTPPVA